MPASMDDIGSVARVWHRLPLEAAARSLGVDPETGLDAAEAQRRLVRYGPNSLPESARRSLVRMIADQFNDFMILVLMVAAVVSGIIGDPGDTVAIVVIVLLNAAIGFAQEYRAERAMAALQRLAAPSARVRRGGAALTVPADRLVPGDLVLLEAGAIVPADLRLIDTAQLQLAEAVLTGESQPVDKNAAALAAADAPLGDRLNMAHKGTVVTRGRGTGVTVATGLATELGKIAQLLAGAEEVRTPLQKRLARFGTRLSLVVLAICAIVFIVGLLRGEPPVLMFLTAVSLAVAAIPEALPAVVTISLALGARKMARHSALIRRLPAVETLGSVTTICSDKTGTLTENRMRAERFFADGTVATSFASGEPWTTLGRALALCNDAGIAASGASIGDPTELALLAAAAAAGYAKAELEAEAPRVAEQPFDSERMRMATFHRTGGGYVVYVKGAPEALLPLCAARLSGSGGTLLDAGATLAAAEHMAAAGLRVLAVAYRRLAEIPADLDEAEAGLSFLGLVGLIDPPRAEAAGAVAECRRAGIVPVMITGDHPATARAIARRLGIIDDAAAVMTGAELALLSDPEFAARVRGVAVYARVDPAQKIRIVMALQRAGEIVAMTGDGVNDAPALKRADIGVAMGRGGTDVAREAAHMVLADDNFATLVHAVREGRRIYDNIRRFIKYAMSTNAAEIWTIFLAPFLGLPIPLLPIHILWINLVTDGLPGLALASEPAERDVMRRPPRPPEESVFARGMWQHIVWAGLLMGGVALGTQAWAHHNGSAHWQTMVFMVLTLSQLGHVLAIRSERESLFAIGIASNPRLLAAVLFTVLLQLATVYLPLFNAWFKTEPLSAGELAACLALSAIVFLAVEFEKWLVRAGWIYRNKG
ncbi:MAG TPA: cation-translocating P-type ATPase [Rhodocyclaceae bacterium]|nr:cation-translocating P-type ATPase [Rhodocyclaceae bacterium]